MVGHVHKSSGLRKFFSEDPKLQELCKVFAQKFSAMGTKKSYTMTTLGDLIWTVSCEVAEAMSEGRVPGLATTADLESLQKQHEVNVKSFERLRLEYSKELFEMRDRLRTLPDAYNELAGDLGGEEPTYRYEPYHHMTPELKEFVDAVVEEKIKLAMLKGVGASRAMLDDLMARVAELEKSCVEKDEQNENLRELLAKRDEEIEKLKKRLNEPHKQLDDPRVPELEAKIALLEAQIEKMRQPREVKEEKKEPEVVVKEDDTELQRELQRLRDLVAKLQREVETKDQAIQTLNAKIKKLEKEVQTLKEEKERLEKLVNESGDNSKFLERIKELEEEVAELQRRLDAAEREKKRMTMAMQAMQEEGGAVQTIEVEKVVYASDDDALRRLQEELDALRAQLEEEKDRADTLEKKYKDALAQVDTLTQQLKDLQAALDAAADASEMQRLLAAKDKQIADLEAQLAKLQARIKALLEKGSGVSQEEFDALKAENDELKRVIAALQQQLQDMIDLLKKHGISEKEILGMLQKSGLAGYILSGRRVFDRLYEDAMARIDRLKILREKVWGQEEEELLKIFRATIPNVVPSLCIGAQLSILLPPDDPPYGGARSRSASPEYENPLMKPSTPRGIGGGGRITTPREPVGSGVHVSALPQPRPQTDDGPQGHDLAQGLAPTTVGFSHFDYGKMSRSSHREDSVDTLGSMGMSKSRGRETPMTRASSADPTRSVSPAFLGRDGSKASLGGGASHASAQRKISPPPGPAGVQPPPPKTLPPPRPPSREMDKKKREEWSGQSMGGQATGPLEAVLLAELPVAEHFEAPPASALRTPPGGVAAGSPLKKKKPLSLEEGQLPRGPIAAALAGRGQGLSLGEGLGEAAPRGTSTRPRAHSPRLRSPAPGGASANVRAGLEAGLAQVGTFGPTASSMEVHSRSGIGSGTARHGLDPRPRSESPDPNLGLSGLRPQPLGGPTHAAGQVLPSGMRQEPRPFQQSREHEPLTMPSITETHGHGGGPSRPRLVPNTTSPSLGSGNWLPGPLQGTRSGSGGQLRGNLR